MSGLFGTLKNVFINLYSRFFHLNFFEEALLVEQLGPWKVDRRRLENLKAGESATLESLTLCLEDPELSWI